MDNVLEFCHRGHLRLAETTYLDGRCKVCCKEDRKKWYSVHKVEQDARNLEWRLLNPKRFKKLNDKNYQENKEARREKDRRWSKNNPERKRIARRKRRALLLSVASIDYTPEQLAAKMSYFGNRCVYCGGALEEVDHAIPLSRGGLDMLANLVPACISCNRRKFKSTWKEFLSE